MIIIILTRENLKAKYICLFQLWIQKCRIFFFQISDNRRLYRDYNFNDESVIRTINLYAE